MIGEREEGEEDEDERLRTGDDARYCVRGGGGEGEFFRRLITSEQQTKSQADSCIELLQHTDTQIHMHVASLLY